LKVQPEEIAYDPLATPQSLSNPHAKDSGKVSEWIWKMWFSHHHFCHRIKSFGLLFFC